MHAETGPSHLLRSLSTRHADDERLTHLEVLPARPGATADWPEWLPGPLREAWSERGVARPWTHQVEAAEAARAGRHVVLSTGTASGKSLGYLLPGAHPDPRVPRPVRPARRDGAVPLADQGARPGPALVAAGAGGPRPGGHHPRRRLRHASSGSSPATTASTSSPTPTCCTARCSPATRAGRGSSARSRYVVVDECHHYRGVFGAHVAQILRRLRRVCAAYGASPTFVLASATVAEPEVSAGRLTGLPVEAVTDDGSARGAGHARRCGSRRSRPATGEHGAPVRRSATAEVADLLTDLVVDRVRTLAFVRSRRGAETVALTARRLLDEVEPGLGERVAAYRGGYLPEDRRVLEQQLRSGRLLGVAATNALELGIDIAGLDAVLIAGFPGTRAAMWQQVGRAGRGGTGRARRAGRADDPLDTYLVTHPEALLGAPVEANVFDPDNPYVLGPHLCAAAAEIPLTEADLPLFGPGAREGVDALTAAGLLRRRAAGWFWTDRRRASDLADIRSSGGSPVRLVEESTGRLVGTVDHGSAHGTVHAGAVYLHQGETYLVTDLDLDDNVAVLAAADPDYSTSARDVTDIEIIGESERQAWGPADVVVGDVRVSHQVVSFLRKQIGTGEVLGEEPLDLPERVLQTKAVWWTLPAGALAGAGLAGRDLPGAAHAAEHASIGLLPLFATCDRWDIGGVSTALHPDTGRLTVFVYDGHPGGAGFAERGFRAAREWLAATRETIAGCRCPEGCPSCVQSPKCGNNNAPLDKAGAVDLLDLLLSQA